VVAMLLRHAVYKKFLIGFHPYAPA
jgi:hypothetical protein